MVCSGGPTGDLLERRMPGDRNAFQQREAYEQTPVDVKACGVVGHHCRVKWERRRRERCG